MSSANETQLEQLETVEKDKLSSDYATTEISEQPFEEIIDEQPPIPKKPNAFSRFFHRIRAYLRLIHFRQIRGISVPEATSEAHVCLNCDHSFVGNHCNNCGQKSDTQRYTRKSLVRNILGGISNIDSGFPLTLKELITRPGYMINDYIAGKRVRYFRPFSTLFILAALYVLLTQFIDPDALKKASDEDVPAQEQTESMETKTEVPQQLKIETNKLSSIMGSKPIQLVKEAIVKWSEGNKAAGILAILPILAFSAKLAFRKRKHNRHYNYVEFLYAQAYISCQLLLIGIFFLFITWKSDMNSLFAVPIWLMLLLSVYTYKQLFRGNWFNTTMRTLLTYFYTGFFVVIIAIALMTLFLGIAILFHLAEGNSLSGIFN